jgi:hypothetical protein
MKKNVFLQNLLLTTLALVLSSCGGRVVVPDGAPKATIQIVLPKLTIAGKTVKYSTAGDITLGLAGKLDCTRLLGRSYGERPMTEISSLTKFSDSNPTAIPAGEEKLFVLNQVIGIQDRVGSYYWTMFVKPNATYEVVVKNTMQDKSLFGQYVSGFDIEVLEDKSPVLIVLHRHPNEECEETQ